MVIVDWFVGRTGKITVSGMRNRRNYCVNLWCVHYLQMWLRASCGSRTACWMPICKGELMKDDGLIFLTRRVQGGDKCKNFRWRSQMASVKSKCG